jgi:hypothetical protein
MFRDNRSFQYSLLLSLLSIGGITFSSANGQGISVTVYPALAPNAFGSPSFPTWESNNIAALQNSLTNSGDPTLPSYYQQIPTGSLIQPFIATEFPSWLLHADPGSFYGPAFASELGNRLYFGLHVVGNGQQFSISQLSFMATSSDAGNFLGFSVAAGSYNYNSGYVGLNYGPDGMRGTMDDFLVTSGVNTQLIDELFARGSGNAPGVMIPDPGATDQEKIDLALANLPIPFVFTGDYSLSTDQGTFNGSAFVIVGIPEPATLAIAMLGGGGMAVCCLTIYRRSRRRVKRRALPPCAKGTRQVSAL